MPPVYPVTRRFFDAVVLLFTLTASSAARVLAQDVAQAAVRAPSAFHACYDPVVGALYLIKLPGLAEQCLKATHLEIVLRGAAGDDAGIAAAPTGPAGGDLGGTYPNPLVAGLQGRPVSANVPTAGQALFFTAGQWRPVTPAFNGDVTGGVNSTKVVKLQNQSVSATVPTNGQVLQWDGTNSLWTPATPASGVTAHNQLTGLTNDDHTQYLLGDGLRAVTNGPAITGTVGTGAIPASGPGTRLMWYPGKSAFRVGTVSSNFWDDASVGLKSVAMGENTSASGPLSLATGQLTTASGTISTALGWQTTASGQASTAIGSSTLASGEATTAMGQGTKAIGFRSTAMGQGTTAQGGVSTAMGYNTFAAGSASLATGNETYAGGDESTAMGRLSLASGSGAVAIGVQATAVGVSAVALGEATTAQADHSTAMGYATQAQGPYSTALGSGSIASGQYATAMGWNTLASGSQSTAMGISTSATGVNSTALGQGTSASQLASTAMGRSTVASGIASVAMGDESSAIATRSTAMGYKTTAGTGWYTTAMGYKSVASGQTATAMGDSAVASGTAATAMGSHTVASGDYSTALGVNASTNGQAGSFVWGDNTGTTTLTATATNQFSLRASGGLRLRTAADLSTGCDLSAGSGVWNCTSSKAQKTEFADVAGDALLARLRQLPVQTWRYTSEDTTVRHMGPFAEDFRAAFGLGRDSLTIGHIDLGGVSLAAAKALEERTRALQAAGEAKDREIAALRASLAELTARLERIEKGSGVR